MEGFGISSRPLHAKLVDMLLEFFDFVHDLLQCLFTMQSNAINWHEFGVQWNIEDQIGVLLHDS